jgi:hypothetical protein
MAVFTHRHGAYITMEDPQFQPLEAYFVAHDKSLPREWSRDPVFIRLHPKWMVGYAWTASNFPVE